MRNTLALARRILQQFGHDKRTIVMFLAGPILVLWLFSVLLNSGSYHPSFACVNLPDKIIDALAEENASSVACSDLEAARTLLERGEVDAVLTLEEGVLTVLVEGADPSKTGSVIAVVQSAVKTAGAAQREELQEEAQAKIDDLKEKMEALKAGLSAGLPPSANIPNIEFPDFDSIAIDVVPLVEDVEIGYLHGDDSWGTFDFFGPVFIGIFIFIFVFITSGMSLVTERTGGTMERLLVTPIKPSQLVCGFCLGFGLVTIIQASIVLWACVTLIGFPNEGSLALVVLIAFTMALVSLTLGLVVSAVAKTPFQVIQFMLLLVIPQVLLSGIFDLG
ncbi:MAG: ABC transporter permease, partial [Eggerthellaceae bacterium]|nr:ABC transporter permease [Eggerthellaceae bacterium]